MILKVRPTGPSEKDSLLSESFSCDDANLFTPAIESPLVPEPTYFAG